MKHRLSILFAGLALIAVSAVSVCSFAGKKAKRLEPYAFYEACKAYYEGVVSKNWKDEGKAREKIGKDVEEYGEPIVGWQFAVEGLMDRVDLSSYLDSNKERLQAGRNDLFYKGNASAGYPDFIVEGISNDYEYVLWNAMWFYSGTADSMTASGLLEEYYKGAYPFAQYLEYHSICRDARGLPEYGVLTDDRKAGLEAFAEKYKGKAISLFAERDLLSAGMNGLKSSDGFRAFRQECAGFEKRRASYRGQEAAIAESCTGIEEIIRKLDSKDIAQSCDRDTVFVFLRNLDGADVELWAGDDYKKDGKRPVWSTELDNGVQSYYVYDTLQFVLPPVDDGEYTVICRNGREVSEGRLVRTSVSIAGRNNGEYALYAADARSGKPLTKADLTIRYKGEVQKVVRGFCFDGFTALPDDVVGLIESNGGQTFVSCSYVDGNGLLRKSGEVSLYKRGIGERSREDAVCAEIFLDRAAYNPGDTVRFKTVIYSRGEDGMSVMPGVKDLSVTVLNPEQKAVKTIGLVTNEFGSASGEIVLPERMERNGRYLIHVSYADRRLASAYFIADEFVLPTYTIDFEKDDSYHAPGDTIVVRGRVKSWSGHPLSSASVTYSVLSEDFGQNGTLAIGQDGAFEIVFRSKDVEYAGYRVNVKVVDLTGETKEASTYLSVHSHLYLSTEIKDEAEGQVELLPDGMYYPRRSGSASIMEGDAAVVKFIVHGSGAANVPKEVEYRVLAGTKCLEEGKAVAGEFIAVDLSGYPAGVYTLEGKSSYKAHGGKDVEINCVRNLVKVSDKDNALHTSGVRNLFRKLDDGRIGAQFGSTDGPVWAVAELYDDKGRVLRSDKVYLDGCAGKDGSLTNVDYEYKEEYPDAVTFRIFYFKDERRFEYYTEFSRPQPSYDLPIEFVSFMDRSMPGALTEFRVRTLPGVECLVSVFDRSTESIMRNVWRKADASRAGAVRIYIDSDAGMTVLWDRGGRLLSGRKQGFTDETIPFQLAGNKSMASKAVSPMVPEEAAVDTFAGDLADADAGMAVRDDFRETIAFLPFLRSDKDGYIDFTVIPSGKLTTYCVSLFAHDKNMRNSLLRRELTVTLPVKVSVMEPGFLYEGDRYRLKASVSNVGDRPVEGMLTMYVYDTKDYKDAEPIAVKSSLVKAGAGQAGAEEFEVKVPSGADVLGFKVVFSADIDGAKVSDGVFVDVPVKPAAQRLVEAHSAVLTDSADKEALVDSLEKSFVNVSAMGAEYREISLKELLLNSLPEKTEAESQDVLSYSEAYYSNRLLSESGQVPADEALMQDLVKKIHDSQNADGGFGWFAGMKSSEHITAAILEMAHRAGPMLDNEQIGKAIGYLDARQAGNDRWGGLSLGQYLNVRSMYAEIPFDVNAGKEEMSKFRNEVREWLKSKDEGAEKHYILERARRASVKLNLAAPEAEALGKAWKLGSGKSLLRSVRKEMEALAEYAVKHPSGGYYFPNAVMPFRGLLESELYAHVMLCDLFGRVAGMPEAGFDAVEADTIADGLRLWMMVQKETQEWENDPSYIEAVLCALGGSEKVLDTKVLTLTKRFLKPFDEINAAGNGMRISRKYYKVTGQVPENGYKDMPAIEEGDMLSVGDRIVAVYEVWSQENRSFVRITAPRYASLRPVQQISGIIGRTFRPFAVPGGKMMIYPQGYRNVRTDRTELYFDVLPEENMVFTEEFHVTQAGKFTSPAVTAECLYAPHYRANDAFSGCLSAE